MSDPKSTAADDPAEASPASISHGPYEALLTKAFDKLTSQIFIFLLAYVILLISLSVLSPQLTNAMRNLLYIIPVLGVMAYIWLQQKKIVKDAKEQGIDLQAGIVSGSARVTGVRGAKADSALPESVRLRVGVAGGKADVGGVIYGDGEPEVPQNSYLEVLSDIFKKLSKSNQIKLISSAQSLLERQEDRRV
jgi:hypothetical protein